ncbi:hypothetical protein K1719_004838 [Acacia pycnantha]|nr:hypothetical protein K1719_004838 [Acacia pycnantha]
MKPTPIIAVDEPAKGLRIRGQTVRKPTISVGFWSSSTPTPIIAVDEPAKGLRIRGQTVRKPTISVGFWSSSTCDLDNNTVQSQRSITSVSTLNQLFYHSSELSPAGTHPEFVNQGLLFWNEGRIQWVGGSRSQKQNKQKQEPKLNWNATYDSLLWTKQPFPSLRLKWLNSW